MFKGEAEFTATSTGLKIYLFIYTWEVLLWAFTAMSKGMIGICSDLFMMLLIVL